MDWGKKILAICALVVTLLFSFLLVVAAKNSPIIARPTPPATPLIEAPSAEPSATPNTNIPKLEAVAGEVEVASPLKEFEKAQDAFEVTVGTKIKTGKGSRVNISFANKSVARLNENTSVLITKIQNENKFSASILIEYGQIWSRVAKLGSDESFEIKTPSTVTNVKGTSFGVTYDKTNNQNIVVTTKGITQTNCLNKSGEATLANQKGIFTCRENSKPTVSIISPKDKSDAWFAYNLNQDDLMDTKFGLETFEGGILSASESAKVNPSVEITSIDTTQKCFDRNVCEVVIKGFGLASTTQVDALQNSKILGSTKLSRGEIEIVSDNLIKVRFALLPAGSFNIQIVSTISKSEFTVSTQ